MPSLYSDAAHYNPPKPPSVQEVDNGKLITVKEEAGVEFEIRRLSGRYFGVIDEGGTHVFTEGHDSREEAVQSGTEVARLIGPIESKE